MSSPMTFILIEDDENECQRYRNYFFTRDDIQLLAVSNSSKQGIQDVETYQPDAVILDMELNLRKRVRNRFFRTITKS